MDTTESKLKEIFGKPGKLLYHYTSLSSAIKILKSRKLKFSDMANSNDILESWRPQYYGTDGKPLHDENKYMTICFTKDTKKVRGFARSSMWGHYADKGYGVCIAFDKKKILSNIPDGAEAKAIDYRNYKNEPVPFCKTPEWKIEAEFRIRG